VTELVHSVVRAGSSLLGSAQSLAWRDLGLAAADSALSGGSRDLHARTTATALLTGLEENAFLLANTISRQKPVFQAFDNIRKI
jgi:adhesion G protein-coupled receptor L1